MAPVKQKSSPEEMRKMVRLMQMRMLNNALHHFKRINARTLRILQALDLFKGKAGSIGNNLDIPVLRDPRHPRREKLSAGPLVLYITEGEKPNRMVVELPVLFFSEIPDVRKVALECLEQMIHDDSLAITPKTGSVLKNLRKPLMSDEPNEWRRAAVGLCDALSDDVLIALQGARQSLESEPMIQDSLNSYVPKVLQPTISSLDSISLDISDPENKHDQMAKVIGEVIAKAQSLTDVCVGYYKKLGYLPLAPRYGMVEAVQRWLAAHPDTDAWTEVWGWADVAFGPIPRYHACCVFASRPELVPQGRLPDLWNQILSVVRESDKKGANQPGREAWELRRDLVRHYTYHLEARLPDNKGTNIACFAWWFCDQVAALFVDKQDDLRFYRENWVQPALELSSHIWLMASPYIQRSFLRYVTLMVPSPWAVGLLSIMGDKIEELAPGAQSEEVRTQFYEALVTNIISSLPLPVQSPSDPTFALECSLADTVLKWAKYHPEEQRKPLEQLVATSQALGTPDELCKALRKLGELSLADQAAVAVALKAKAYTDPTIAKGVWEVLSDTDWRLKVLSNIETLVLGLLIEVFSILQVDNRDKWFSLLPHYIADLCEKTEDEERRRHLFFFLLYTSLASDTVSAVRRLLRGNHKAKYIELAKDYRDRVEAMRSEYPPWVAGKIRGLIANLHVV
ncbi:MAG: hypothetical protein Q8P51_01490 [Ignavibacteria bacterium]|nr:hypothetical protein [Ignavibacteria bacterium]